MRSETLRNTSSPVPITMAGAIDHHFHVSPTRLFSSQTRRRIPHTKPMISNTGTAISIGSGITPGTLLAHSTSPSGTARSATKIQRGRVDASHQPQRGR